MLFVVLYMATKSAKLKGNKMAITSANILNNTQSLEQLFGALGRVEDAIRTAGFGALVLAVGAFGVIGGVKLARVSKEKSGPIVTCPYTVGEGGKNTVASIADTTSSTMDELKDWNKLPADWRVDPGQVLQTRCKQ